MGARAGPAQGPLPQPKLLPQSYLGRVSRGNALPKRGTTVSMRAEAARQASGPAAPVPDREEPQQEEDRQGTSRASADRAAHRPVERGRRRRRDAGGVRVLLDGLAAVVVVDRDG